jgi:demethylmenaquinone methyltransferase/2-methoxy-6-polyprenyl-1,4-benzoquinol methylase
VPKKEGIRTLFDSIAKGYDRFNHLSSLNADKGWRRKAVRAIVDTREPLAVLDVATGTADLAIAVAKKAAEGSQVIGIDLSEGMLEVGRKKAEGLPVTLQQGDAEALSYADGTFDRVSVAFGVRNFENLSLGLREMCRVLKPGGRLVILELSYPDNRFLLWCYKIYAFKILPAIGTRLTGNRGAYTYLPDSILKFPKPPVFLPMLREAGFTSAKARSLTFGICRMYVAEK